MLDSPAAKRRRKPYKLPASISKATAAVPIAMIAAGCQK
jgi:hypothetical protein